MLTFRLSVGVRERIELNKAPDFWIEHLCRLIVLYSKMGRTEEKHILGTELRVCFGYVKLEIPMIC